MRASEEREKENYELSYDLMYKTIECMKASRIMYGKKNTYSLLCGCTKMVELKRLLCLRKDFGEKNQKYLI